MGLDIAYSVTPSWGNLKQEVSLSVKRHVSLSEFQSLLLSQKPGRMKQWHHGTSLHLVQSKGLWVQGDLTNLSGPGPQLLALLALPGGSTSPSRPQGRTPREGGVSQQTGRKAHNRRERHKNRSGKEFFSNRFSQSSPGIIKPTGLHLSTHSSAAFHIHRS